MLYKQFLLGLATITLLAGVPSLPAFADEPAGTEQLAVTDAAVATDEASEALAADRKLPKLHPAAARNRTAAAPARAKRAHPRQTAALRVAPVERAPVRLVLVLGL
jgi:hypothetical protein